MDAVEGSDSFTIAQDGHRIGELIPLKDSSHFVPRSVLTAISQNTQIISMEAFRADQDAAAVQETDTP
jgi:hypothetical protein